MKQKMNNNLQKIIYSVSNNRSVRFLKYKSYYLQRDIYNTVSIVFNIETAIRKGYNVDHVDIPISKETYIYWDIKRIQFELNDLLESVLMRDIEIRFWSQDLNKRRRNTIVPFDKVDNICLFSGGVDSSTGIIHSKLHFSDDIRGLFICHGDQGKTKLVVDRTYNRIKQELDLRIDTLHVPKIYSEGYSQLRGFLYFILGGVYASLLNSTNLLITECGITMYQPRFSPYDAVTMTTHPYILKKVKILNQLFLNRDINIITPFEDMTKAEILAINPIPDMIHETHSCISTRWINSGIKGRMDNDGTCYGCTIRRLGSVVAGVRDVEYENNPFDSTELNVENMITILAFSLEVLSDFDTLDHYIVDDIKKYGKKDLFQRFALDNIASVHESWLKKQISNPLIIKMYKRIINSVDKKAIKHRLTRIRQKELVPNYSGILV